MWCSRVCVRVCVRGIQRGGCSGVVSGVCCVSSAAYGGSLSGVDAASIFADALNAGDVVHAVCVCARTMAAMVTAAGLFFVCGMVCVLACVCRVVWVFSACRTAAGSERRRR